MKEWMYCYCPEDTEAEAKQEVALHGLQNPKPESEGTIPLTPPLTPLEWGVFCEERSPSHLSVI